MYIYMYYVYMYPFAFAATVFSRCDREKIDIPNLSGNSQRANSTR